MALPGDQVTITCKDTSYEGTLMPRPELLSSDITVLKLSNGYNIGISKDRIKNITVKKKHTPAKKKSHKITQKKGLPTIALLSCGGTIASRVDYHSGGVYADYDAADFVAMCPELAIHANIISVKTKQLMSEDARFPDWQDIATAVKDALNAGADGVVVTHGTDTMHYTAAALSFLLKDLKKPVVFTGSQRSIDRPSSDAFMNLTCAVIAAASGKFRGVVTCMHGTSDDRYCLLINGTKVRKMHTSRRDAFRPLNAAALGRVFPNGKIDIQKKTLEADSGTVSLNGGFESKVGLVYSNPSLTDGELEHYLSHKYRGLVIAATALGHVPSGKGSLIPAIKKAVANGMVVVISSQTLYGRVHPYVYTNLRKLSVDAGAVFVEDMHPETALVKLAWSLSKAKNAEEAKSLVLTDIAGEFQVRSTPFDQFLS